MVETSFGIDLKNKLLAGIQKLNNSVSSTLGPGGRTVLIKDGNGEIKVTKDGVTVAKAFSELPDQVEDLGAQLVKQVSIKSANEAGDGTTTSTLLATTMVEEGLKLINQGSNPVEVKRGIDKYTKLIVDQLKGLAKDVASQEQIKQWVAKALRSIYKGFRGKIEPNFFELEAQSLTDAIETGMGGFQYNKPNFGLSIKLCIS